MVTIVNGLTIEKVQSYDPYNARAKSNGIVTEWVGRNDWGNSIVFGNTKKECIDAARRISHVN